jgi:hypothetical protein
MAYAMLGIRSFSDVFSVFSGPDDVFKVIYALALIMQLGLIIIPILILSKVDDTSIMKKFKELEVAPGLTKAFMKFTAIAGGIAICLYLLVFAVLAYGRFDPLTNQLTWVLAVAFPAVFLLGYRSIMRGSYFGLMLTNLMLPILYFGSMTVLASFRVIPGMSEGGLLAAISMLFGLLMLFLPLTAILVALIVLEIKLITPQEKKP